jgi:hypothetical protein
LLAQLANPSLHKTPLPLRGYPVRLRSRSDSPLRSFQITALRAGQTGTRS